MTVPVIVDEGDHVLCRRSSSAIAKCALVLRRISLACQSARFSRSRDFVFSVNSLGTPARLLLSTSAFLTHSCNMCTAQPILAEIGTTAAHRDSCCPSRSRTMRTARLRTSGEYVFPCLLMMLLLARDLEPPASPARFKGDDRAPGPYRVLERVAVRSDPDDQRRSVDGVGEYDHVVAVSAAAGVAVGLVVAARDVGLALIFQRQVLSRLISGHLAG